MTSPRVTDSKDTVLSHTGFAYFPIALIARLPFAMMVVGVLTLVVAGRGSMQLGGFNSAMVGLGAAIFGPLVGALADKYGQRLTLLGTVVVNSIALTGLAIVVYTTLPNWIMLATSFIIGASAPQTSPMSRTRLVTIITDKLPTIRRDRSLNSVMAYESAADETVFVFGPFIVGLLAVAFGPAAPIYGGVVLTLIFVTAFAFHRTGTIAKTRDERAATLAPGRELLRPNLLIVVVGIFGVGLFFGGILTSLTAFMQTLGREEEAGLLYGVMGIGSAILAISVAFFPPSFSRRMRWLTFALLMLAGSLQLQFADSVGQIVFALAIIGLGIGPVLVTQYSFGADRSPVGRGTTVMTMLGSAIIVGQSLNSALTGWLAEAYGTDVAFLMPLFATVLVVVSGVVNLWLTPGGSGVGSRTRSIRTESAPMHAGSSGSPNDTEERPTIRHSATRG